jgi:acyl carrier protein
MVETDDTREAGERAGGGRGIAPDAVLDELRELVAELEPGKGREAKVRLDSSLGRDLGLDSLGRAELVRRLERRFGRALPERVLTDAESPRDLLREVRRASAAELLPVAAPWAPAPAPPDERALAEREGVEVPERAETLLEVFDWHADAHPHRRHILFLEKGPGEGAEKELTYGELLLRARRAGAAFQGMGLDPGESVGIMLPTGLEYFAAFLGTLLAGGVPVPLYPPARKSQIEDHLRRQGGIPTRPSCSTPRAARRRPRGSCSATPTSWPMCGRSAMPSRCARTTSR